MKDKTGHSDGSKPRSFPPSATTEISFSTLECLVDSRWAIMFVYV